MFAEFVYERMEKATKPLFGIFPRINMYTFNNRPPADLKKGSGKLRFAKANATLITKLFF